MNKKIRLCLFYIQICKKQKSSHEKKIKKLEADIQRNVKEIVAIQKKCKHLFVDDECIYCKAKRRQNDS